jgi:uncharacterized BrkB/YihY/UPF0761 family membrane protein
VGNGVARIRSRLVTRRRAEENGASRWVLKTAFAGWWNDRAMGLGAASAFLTVFSLAPMALVVITVAAWHSDAKRSREQLGGGAAPRAQSAEGG